MVRTKAKPVTGHKRAVINRGVRVHCECGWSTTTRFEKDAEENALDEWRDHQDEHACEHRDKDLTMASLRARRANPWILEMEAVGQWFEIARFFSEDEAQARLKRMKKSGNPVPLRVRMDDI